MAAFEETKLEIDELVAKAQEVIAPRLAPVQKVIDDIKVQLAHGTDRIPTSQLHEWGLVLSIMSAEMTPQKEAYGLACTLWKSDMSRTKAATLAERRLEKKAIADAENEAILLNADKEVQKLIIEYMSGVIKSTKEDIYMMCSELNRIMDARNRNGEAK